MALETLHPEPQPVPLREDAHGVIRVGQTRVPLETVMAAFHNGASAEEIAADYPVALADVYAVIAYYLRHTEEVDAYLERSDEEAQRTRADAESRQDSAEFRERLLQRTRARGRR